eukprot:366000-Chlamydomonas_euryale.AAC.18
MVERQPHNNVQACAQVSGLLHNMRLARGMLTVLHGMFSRGSSPHPHVMKVIHPPYVNPGILNTHSCNELKPIALRMDLRSARRATSV